MITHLFFTLILILLTFLIFFIVLEDTGLTTIVFFFIILSPFLVYLTAKNKTTLHERKVVQRHSDLMSDPIVIHSGIQALAHRSIWTN